MPSVENNLFQYGATWIKADFHLHTRADKEFKYAGRDNSFITDFIAKLKEEEIRVGVITNHNKFDCNEFKCMRSKAIKENIYLMPGVELSANDGANGVHTLIVFSEQWLDKGQDYISLFISSMFPGKAAIEYQNENGRSDKSILQIVEELDKTSRDYFLIFAHVEQQNGLWKELNGGRLSDFSDKRYESVRQRTLGFQKVRTHDVQEEGRVCRTKVQNWLHPWYPAEVEGSDCKAIDAIGRQTSYLKLGDFKFEAVKYALYDYRNRISQKPAPYPHSHIKSISFEGGILDGKSISFSPELNVMIGIRGSGKSSILESLRYVLGIPFGEKSRDTDYKASLIQHAFGSGGKATILAVDHFGQEYKIKRVLNEKPQVFVENKLQPGISIHETVIRKPLYFGQKDLSESGEGFEKDLVEKLLGGKLYELRRQIEDQKQVLSDAIDRYLKLSNIDEQTQEYERIKQDTLFRLDKFKKYGVEEKLQKQTDFETDERKMKQMLSDIDSYTAAFSVFISQYEDDLANHKQYNSKRNKEFFGKLFTIYDDILKSLENIKREYHRTQNNAKSLQRKLEEFLHIKQKILEEFAETRRSLEKELKSKGGAALNLEEFPTLQKKLDMATQMLNALSKQRIQKNSVTNDLLSTLSVLNDLWHQEYQLVDQELYKVNKKNASLRIETKFKGDKKAFLRYLQNMFRGSKIRESTFHGLVDSYNDFGEMFKDWPNVLKQSGSSPHIFEKYFFENLKSLISWQVPNSYVIKYRGKELKHHSLGQRASALILFVLSQQENDVIIIDQPEDDLDNQTIYDDVIKLIHSLKGSTQFIFATHNANVPVLGDAEQIHSCQYSDEKLHLRTGSIDSPTIQREIVNVMEGGEDAFNRRKEIYQIWKPQS